MAYAYSHQRIPQQRQQQQPDSAISLKQPAFFHDPDDEAATVLDPTVLSADPMANNPDDHLRRSSLANSNDVLSPAESQSWEQQYINGLGVDGVHTPFQDDHSAFVRPHPPPIQTFVGHPQWHFSHPPGHVTPPTGVDYLPHHPSHPPFSALPLQQHYHDNANPTFPHPHSYHTAPAQTFNGPPPPEGDFIPVNSMPTPMSPHSHTDYMAMTAREMENRTTTSRRMRPASPPRTSVDEQRRSGIRKKNGRIEIPQERSIDNIDNLIEDAGENEDLIKELKQQKRLLRNREAALQSRQRKKHHTEQLESQQKEYHEHLEGMKYENHDLAMRNQTLLHSIAELRQQIDVMREESRQERVRYDNDTSHLRRQVQLLREQADLHQAPAMSANPSSIGGDFTADMEALAVSSWDELFLDGLAFDLKPEPAHPSSVVERRPTPNPVPASAPRPSEGTQEPPVATGLLFFLLLCGAFVVSKPSSSRPTDLPEVPDAIRAAAPAVLNNLLSETASTHQPSRSMDPTSQPASASMVPQHRQANTGRLDRMHRRITSPTKQQEIDSAFALTTAQYASISDPDFHDTFSRPAVHRRPNLAEVLAKSRDEYLRTTKAEVYTRSLLLDTISPETVRQFKEMVRDCEEIEGRQRQGRGDDDEEGRFGFKVEG